MSVPPAIFQIAQEGNHLTRSRLPTNRNFVHGGPTGRAAQAHSALGKRKGTEMATPANKQPMKHFVEIPKDISEMSDAQIKAWAKEVYREFSLVVNDEVVKKTEENDSN